MAEALPEISNMQLDPKQDETVNNIVSLLHSMKNGKDMITGDPFSLEEMIKFSGQLHDVVICLWEEIACDHSKVAIDAYMDERAAVDDEIRCADLNERLGDIEDAPWLVGAKLDADRS